MPATPLRTVNESPSCRLGLAGSPHVGEGFVDLAAAAGVNFFFFYNLSYAALTTGLRPLLAERREDVIVATGSECRDVTELRTYIDSVRRLLGIDTLDIFFIEYVSPADDMAELLAADGVFSELTACRERGEIRYVGFSAHSRALTIELIQSGRVDVLMHRYNMAHRGPEERVLPAARAAGIPLVAFTCTRWGTLLRGHGDWGRDRPVPSAVDCYGFALSHPAVQVALTAPSTVAQLQSNLEVLKSRLPMGLDELNQWREYGDLVYGDGASEFETGWP
jgi:aryl-alcohol dehydrogenase-like predicted oxidoreductase